MSGYDTGLGGRQDPPAGSGYVPAFDGNLTTRSSAAPRARDPFDPTSVVVDPQIPSAGRAELERRGGPDYGVLASAELVRFMDPPPVAPAPPGPSSWYRSWPESCAARTRSRSCS